MIQEVRLREALTFVNVKFRVSDDKTHYLIYTGERVMQKLQSHGVIDPEDWEKTSTERIFIVYRRRRR